MKDLAKAFQNLANSKIGKVWYVDFVKRERLLVLLKVLKWIIYILNITTLIKDFKFKYVFPTRGISIN